MHQSHDLKSLGDGEWGGFRLEDQLAPKPKELNGMAGQQMSPYFRESERKNLHKYACAGTLSRQTDVEEPFARAIVIYVYAMVF